jgi:hypothetical protein
MRKFWIKAATIFSVLCWSPIQASASSVFSYAQINVPFEVRVDGSWVQIIENREDWEAFYVENAQNYHEADSDLNTPPDIDFEAYTIIAGGLGAGSANRSLSISSVNANSSATHVNALVVTGRGCVVLAVATYPTVVILIPKPMADVRVSTREAFYDCE